jgi:two-component system sensor histidine kinase/response regulator
MGDSKKTKKQLIEELKNLRKEIARLEESQSESKEREKELLRDRALFKSFMDHIPISVYFKDKEGRFLRVSKYFLKQKGAPPLDSVDKLVGKTDFDLFSKKHAEISNEDELMVMKTGKPIIDREEESETVDGEKVYLLTSKAPLTDEKGNIIGIVGMTKEVTEKKLSDEEIKERLEKLGEEIVFKSCLLSALLENIPDHIYFKDKKSRFVAVSKALARWLEAGSSEDMIGKTDFDYFTEEHAKPAYLDEQEVMRKGQPIEGKIEKETYSDGRVTWVSTTKIPWYDENGNIIGTFGISRDITELKNKEFELIKAREIAQKASQAKTTFLAIMSHEIRTPLNAIIGMCEILEETVLSKEQHEYLKILREAGETLLAIINDVLDISKIECGDVQIEKSEFSLDSLVEKVCDILAIRAHKKGIELADHISPDVPVNLIGDSYRMRQILVNLIGNSIKFTDEGEIILNISLAEEEIDSHNKTADKVCLLFSVKDTGVGIPEEKQEAIFDSFKQADSSTTRKFGGTGLGLSISKRLVELMGGKMWVESEEGKGSEFFFTVRFGIQKARKVRTFIEPREVDVKGISTLIVDDNNTNRLILKEILTAWDANVTEASGGEEAISIIRTARKKGKNFRLILLDRRMPAVDGFKVAEVIREDKKSEETTTVMMLTSDHRISDLSRIDELGINCYLVKPIKRDELKNAILATLGLWKAREKKIEVDKVKATDLPPMKILLVEDTGDNRLLIEAFLKKSSVEIDEAENGKIAFEKFKKNVYDLVLMDMQMPVMDGYTATKKIRAWEKRVSAEETPVIALTAYALKGDAEKCLDAGCDTHVAKPIKMETLVEVLKEFADKMGL